MKRCAYCQQYDVAFTKDHLLPKCLYARTPEYSEKFLDRARKLVESDAAIGDVCATCNNAKLSTLDAYLCRLYDNYFSKIVQPNDCVEFRYGFDLLARSLLKIAYNSARVHSSDDGGVLANVAGYILDGHPRPRGLTLLLQLVIPAKLGPALAPEFGPEGQVPPFVLRLAAGSLRTLNARKSFSLARLIGLNWYNFYVLFPSKTMNQTRAWHEAKRKFARSMGGLVELSPFRNNVSVRASTKTIFDAWKDSLIHNWSVFQPWLKKYEEKASGR